MDVLLYTMLGALAVVALMMAGLGIKMLCRKRGEFKRHCSSADPYTGEQSGCVCSKAVGAKCREKERYSPLEVNEHLLNEVGGK